MLTKNKILVSSLLLTLSATTASYALPTESGLWFAIGGYAIWFNQPDKKLIYMGGTEPPIPDYYFHASTHSSYSGNLSAGYEFDKFYGYLVTYRLGLIYQNNVSTTTDGKVKNSDQIDYVYQYKLGSRALFIQSQVDMFACQWLGPYLDVEIGAARNEITRYSENTLPNHIPRVSPQFVNHSQVNFAYRLGIGLNYRFDVSSNVFQASMAYVYANYGTARTGNSNYYTAIAGQRIGQRVSGNEFEMTLRYYIE